MEPARETHRFPCPQCGADLRFAPGEGRLVCDHCGHAEPAGSLSRAAAPIAEIELRRAAGAALPAAETELVRFSHCPNCGAVVEFDPAVHAGECPFCATPVVADTGARRLIKPQGLIPFALTEAEARKAMSAWLGSLWFAPSGLAAYARRGRTLQGVYVPYWTFDARTRTRYRGRRGTIYHETRRVHVTDAQGRRRSENRRVAKIRWTPVAGEVARDFDDVLVLASQALPGGHAEALEPWDLAALVPYSPEYLAGFRAEAYTVDVEQGLGRARVIMDRMIERDVRFAIGGDRQQIEAMQTAVSDVTFKHVLLPVWTAAYRYRGRSFRFVVNGQTGRVTGERPWSAIKIAVAALLAVVGAVALAWLAAWADAQGYLGR